MKIPVARISGKHIALFCVLLLGVAVVSFILFFRVPPVARTATCPPLPLNVGRLGPALSPAEVRTLLAAPGSYSSELRQLVGPGVTLHKYRTGVTGGHLAVRGRCYVGQAVAWIR